MQSNLPKLIIYGARGCGWCTKLLDIIRALELDYEKISVRQNESALKLLAEHNLRTVPQVFLETGKHIGGYEDTVSYLKEKGIIDRGFNA